MSELNLRIKIDTSQFVTAMKRVAEIAGRFHEQMHRAGIAFTSGDLKRVRAHRQRCSICSPRANPAPLAIDGHAYARRRKNRRKS